MVSRGIAGRPFRCGLHLRPADVTGVVDELPREVLGLDDVAVDEDDLPDTQADQGLENPGTQSARSEQEHRGTGCGAVHVGAGTGQVAEQVVVAQVAGVTIQRAGVELTVGVGSLEHSPLVELVQHARHVLRRRGGMAGSGDRRWQLIHAVVAAGQDLQQREERAGRVVEVDPLERPTGEHQRAAVAVHGYRLEPGQDGHSISSS